MITGMFIGGLVGLAILDWIALGILYTRVTTSVEDFWRDEAIRSGLLVADASATMREMFDMLPERSKMKAMKIVVAHFARAAELREMKGKALRDRLSAKLAENIDEISQGISEALVGSTEDARFGKQPNADSPQRAAEGS
jgi:hypothetical protein